MHQQPASLGVAAEVVAVSFRPDPSLPVEVYQTKHVQSAGAGRDGDVRRGEDLNSLWRRGLIDSRGDQCSWRSHSQWQLATSSFAKSWHCFLTPQAAQLAAPGTPFRDSSQLDLWWVTVGSIFSAEYLFKILDTCNKDIQFWRIKEPLHVYWELQGLPNLAGFWDLSWGRISTILMRLSVCFEDVGMVCVFWFTVWVLGYWMVLCDSRATWIVMPVW